MNPSQRNFCKLTWNLKIWNYENNLKRRAYNLYNKNFFLFKSERINTGAYFEMFEFKKMGIWYHHPTILIHTSKVGPTWYSNDPQRDDCEHNFGCSPNRTHLFVRAIRTGWPVPYTAWPHSKSHALTCGTKHLQCTPKGKTMVNKNNPCGFRIMIERSRSEEWCGPHLQEHGIRWYLFCFPIFRLSLFSFSQWEALVLKSSLFLFSISLSGIRTFYTSEGNFSSLSLDFVAMVLFKLVGFFLLLFSWVLVDVFSVYYYVFVFLFFLAKKRR